jgi:CheY-like chemotaxis protein
MAILDISPKYGGEGGELVLKDRSTILAYLEDLMWSTVEVQLVVQGHPPLSAHVTLVEDDPPRFKVKLGAPLPVTWIRRKEIVLLFTLDGIRFLAPVWFLERGGYLEALLSIPVAVSHADRRGKMRVHFGPREKATVTVLEGLHEARGATGHLLDLSLEGLRMRVDRAVTIRGKAPLPITGTTFKPGVRFPILRIDQLPYSPVVVCSGVVAHASATSDGVQMGIRFEQLGEMEAQVIRQVLGRRLPKFNLGFPERKRQGSPNREEDAGMVVVRHGDGPELSETPEFALPQDPVKCTKRLLLVMQDDLDRAILVSALRLDGYRKIHEARNYQEALDHVKVFPMDVVILEEKVGTLSAADFLTRLRQQGYCEATPTVLLADLLDVRTRALGRAAQVDYLQALSEDFETEFRDVLEGLLRIT